MRRTSATFSSATARSIAWQTRAVAQRVQISVIGASRGEEEILRDAEEIGARGSPSGGAVLVCGGRHRRDGGGLQGSVGGGRDRCSAFFRTLSPEDANPYVSFAVATGIGEARNLAVVASGAAVIAVGGEWGTLSEIAYARKIGRPVDRDPELAAP